MNRVDLIKIEHGVKTGDTCGTFEPNVLEDSIFYADGEKVGFFIKNLSKDYPKLSKLAALANAELRSKNVPKSLMKRSSGLHSRENEVYQYSTIIGSVPPKPHMRRAYPTISSVHGVKTAQTFIKAMLLACKESESIIKEIMPEQYAFQKNCINENVHPKYKFSDLFTSSISNYNIPANFHTDNGNLKGCVNVIITKKFNATGGNLHVPDYGATMDSAEDSMLVYPAWRNMHGVTPIVPTQKEGYRNSLVFYPLKAFHPNTIKN